MAKTIKDRITNMWLGNFLKRLIISIEFKMIGLYHDKQTMSLMRQIIKEDKPFLLMPSELFLIYSLAKNQSHVNGDYAEVGVFKGATAKAICKVKGNKPLHLFDTFDGLPSVDKEIDTRFKKNMFKSDIQIVRNKLQKYENVHIYKGLFPDTGAQVKDSKFCFVHLDVDTYQSTKNCLEFFYDRMSGSGIIISHDYNAKGVKKAFDEFFTNKPEKVILLPMSQCMITKR